MLPLPELSSLIPFPDQPPGAPNQAGPLPALSEETAGQSEERYRKLLMLSPDANFVYVDGLITLVNLAFCRLMGAQSQAELLGRVALEVVHPSHTERALARQAQLMTNQIVPPSEMIFVRLDGTTVEVEVNSVIVEVLGHQEVQVTARDITERKRFEADLLRQQNQLRVLFDLMPAMIWFKDTENRIIRVNQRVAEMAGKSIEAIEGRPASEIYPEESARFYADDLSVIASGVPRLGVIDKAKDAAGAELWIETDKVPVHDKDGKIVGIVVMAQDITARRLSERALLASEERFKFVARAVSDVVWDWDLQANTLWWNEEFLTTFGFAADEIEPSVKSWTERMHPEDRKRVIESIHAAIAAETENWSAEYRFQRKDGSHAFVEDRGYILRHADGKGIRMVGGMRDLTEQKKQEAQYLRAQRMESIGTLAGGIAHDLNNVLAPIMMSIDLLKLEPGGDARRKKILGIIEASSRRGADLIRQVLAFGRGLDGQRVTVQLWKLVSELEQIISETFPRNILIVADIAENLWPITGDPTQLNQVLLNLAVNARDAMPQGGSLTFKATNLTIDEQYAGSSSEAKAGTYVLLEATDTGTGMSPALRDRVFEPFFTTKPVGQGTGIGLATVHTIVKSHGGFIQIDSELGQGTTFKIHLPADPIHRSGGTKQPFASELPRGNGELVLVIDDEHSIREITQQTLESFGYQVIIARDGVEAIALYSVQAAKIALVLTDMMMPLMDGEATILVLKRINPLVRIIAASGLEVVENVAKASKAGVQDFLPKPFTAETLLRRIRLVLDRPVDALPVPNAAAPDVPPARP